MVKRIVTMLLGCVTILSASVMPVVAADITPYYNNVNRVDSNAWISDAGELSVEYDYTGNADTTSVVITTTVERKTLFFSDCRQSTRVEPRSTRYFFVFVLNNPLK